MFTNNRHKDIEVGELVGAGGQGEVYRARVRGHEMALKLFHERYSESSDEVRARWLVEQRLGTLSTLLSAAPQRVERIGSRLAHLSEFVPGTSLESVMEQAHRNEALPWNLLEALQIAVSIAKGVAICEECGIAVGDIAASNLTIVPNNDHFEIFLMDFDNYAAAGRPSPRMLGQPLYLGPEFLSGATEPTVASDRYALGVLLHEILLLNHPKAGRDGSLEELQRAVAESRWHQDPVYPRSQRASAGYPAEVLTPSIHRLFRLAQSADPAVRPTARVWVRVLWDILDEDRGPGVYECESCGCCFLSDITKDRCPLCGAVHPVLGIEVGGRTIPLDKTVTCIGRGDVSGAQSVSTRHIIGRRVGPEYFVEDISSSGTWRFRNGTWTRLQSRKPVAIVSGDSLRLGDVRVCVVSISSRGSAP